MWLQIDLTRAGTELRAGAQGSRGEQVAAHSLGADSNVEAVLRFGAEARKAALRTKPLPSELLQTARILTERVLDPSIDRLRARLMEAAGGPLLVRLMLPDGELQAVPWEALCEAGQAMGFWATSPDLLPVRAVTTFEPWQPRAVHGALRILPIAPLGGDTLEGLRMSLDGRISAGEVEWLDPVCGSAVTARYLFDRLRREPVPHVLHFLGHGSHERGVPVLRLADNDDGDETWLPVELLAQQLKASLRGQLRLIVLEACEGAQPSAFASAAETLARAGADAVVAHLWPIKTDVARVFSEQLYRALAGSDRSKGDIALAMNEARRAILGTFEGSAEAFSPVVYLRGPSGVLFELKRRSACLVLDHGTREARAFPLRAGKNMIGRTEENEVSIPRQGVSRKHAEVHVHGDRMEVRDCGSRNGTFINGVRVTTARLQVGDVLGIGNLGLTVAMEAAQRAELPSFTCNIHSQHFPKLSIDIRQRPSAKEGRSDILHQVTQMLASQGALEPMLDRLIQLCIQLLAIDRAAVLLVDELGELVPRAVRSRFPIPAGQRIWSNSVVMHVMEQVTAALYSNAPFDPRIGAAGSVLQQSIGAVMATPLKAGDHVIGVLYVDTLQGGLRLQQDDLDLLVGIGNQAALSVERAIVEERAREHAALRERLERFFDPATAQTLMGAEALELARRVQRVTAVFCTVSPTQEMMSGARRGGLELFGDYCTLVNKAIFDRKGAIVGSGSGLWLAVWGAPLSRDDDADRALAAAFAIGRAARDWGLSVRIGMHTGPVVAGNFGTRQYPHVVGIGEATELSRGLCEAADIGDILLSAETVAALRSPPEDLVALPPVQVKWRSEPVEVARLHLGLSKSD